MNRRSAAQFLEPLYPIFIGFVVFLFITKGTILNPTYADWLMQDGDSSQHWLGWQFFRHSPLFQWPLGANPDYGMELGSSIVFSDSIPLFAFIFKPLNAILPETFQYIGLWIAVCFSLQAYFAWKLLRLFTDNKWLALVGCVFFTLAPASLWRLHGHNSLFGHWLILAALYLYFSEKFSVLRWVLLLSAAALTHAYLLAMALAIYLADLVQRYCISQARAVKTIANLLVCGFTTALVMWAAGYFMVGEGVASGGFGFYRMNLLSLIDPDDVWSKVLRDQAQAAGDYEGFNFLGLGMIGLAFIAGYEFFRNPKFSIKNSVIPILCLSVGLFLYAISNHIAIGGHELFTYELPSVVRPLTNAFRASGRFFWPVYYLIYLAVFYLLFTRLTPKAAITVCAVMLAVQLGDFNDIRHRFRERFAYAPTWTSPIRSPMWEELAHRYKKIVVVVPHNASPNWVPLSRFAAKHQMAINIGYFARIDAKKEREAGDRIASSILSNKLNSDSLYIFQDDGLWKFATRQVPDSAVAGILDGFRIIAPDFQNCRICGAAITNVSLIKEDHDYGYQGGRISFTSAGPGKKYMLFGWVLPEAWGVWSDGDVSYLKLDLDKSLMGKGDLELLIEGHAYLTERHPLQAVNVLANGQYVGTLKYDQTWTDSTRSITIPKTIWSENNGHLLLRFDLKNAISPAELGLSTDGRRLGLGIVSMEIREKR